MSGTSGGSSSSDIDRSASRTTLLGRDRLARMVVLGSFVTVFLLVSTLIVLAESNNTRVSDTAEKAFNAILPVLAGWVGTVLAFYFSAASQERTAQSLDKAIGQATGGGPTILVSEKMLPTGSILELKHLDNDKSKPESFSLNDLRDIFNKPRSDGIAITRLVFVENHVFRYVLHVSTLNDFLVAKGSAGTLNLLDLLNDQAMLRQVSKLVVFVSASTTLADAKNALDAVPRAQDIIVTATGNASAPMLGWLTNVDLIKALTPG